MTDEQWRWPTRLGDWDVRSLYAHAGSWPFGFSIVEYFGRVLLRLDEAVSIGILEATVHLLDLQRALGQTADVPVEGLTHTAAVLVQMTPPVDFIEAATGRSTTDLFPVLS